MVETEKKEQRGQAVKRLRSLFDMHQIGFGTPDKLGGVIVNLHENRHFAMDFWALVGMLGSPESGSLTDDEIAGSDRRECDQRWEPASCRSMSVQVPSSFNRCLPESM